MRGPQARAVHGAAVPLSGGSGGGAVCWMMAEISATSVSTVAGGAWRLERCVAPPGVAGGRRGVGGCAAAVFKAVACGAVRAGGWARVGRIVALAACGPCSRAGAALALRRSGRWVDGAGVVGTVRMAGRTTGVEDVCGRSTIVAPWARGGGASLPDGGSSVTTSTAWSAASSGAFACRAGVDVDVDVDVDGEAGGTMCTVTSPASAAAAAPASRPGAGARVCASHASVASTTQTPSPAAPYQNTAGRARKRRDNGPVALPSSMARMWISPLVRREDDIKLGRLEPA
jgi:hypothetical protein